jgi:hypothetical protein
MERQKRNQELTVPERILLNTTVTCVSTQMGRRSVSSLSLSISLSVSLSLSLCLSLLASLSCSFSRCLLAVSWWVISVLCISWSSSRSITWPTTTRAVITFTQPLKTPIANRSLRHLIIHLNTTDSSLDDEYGWSMIM